MMRIAVLGGGNGSHAAVVDLSLKGFEVAWWRRSAASFVDEGAVRYNGIIGSGQLHPALVTADLALAVEGAQLVLVPLPATAQPEVLDQLMGILMSGQAVAFLPGTFGSWLGAQRRPDVDFLEVGTLPYLARVTSPGEVSIPVVATRLPTGSVPGSGPRADAAHALFQRAYPTSVRVTSGLDAALTNWGPVLHPPLVVQNLGAIQSLGDRFDIHNEGTSEAVIRTILALDRERVQLRIALDFPPEHWPISTHYQQSSEGMYGEDARQRLVASDLWRESLHLEHRYVREDILCGLTLNASLGRLAGLPMPVSEALLTLVHVSVGVDPWVVGRTAASIGVPDLDAIRREVRDGVGAGAR